MSSPGAIHRELVAASLLLMRSLTWRRPWPCRNAHYPPHSHAGLTTHLITKGEMTLWYPRDASPEKTTFGVGARVDVDAGRIHEVQVGSNGCTYVIGE